MLEGFAALEMVCSSLGQEICRCVLGILKGKIYTLIDFSYLLIVACNRVCLRFHYRDSEMFSSGKEYAKHGNYVTAVSFCPPSQIYPSGLILTGSNDNLIRGFIEEEASPVLILHGHTGTGLLDP